jgi:hypothetical protein
MREAREYATARYLKDPTEENRQAALVAVRATIEALEDLYSLDLHVAALAKGVDPEWDWLAEEGIEATEIRLVLNYSYLLPSGSFGFTLADL